MLLARDGRPLHRRVVAVAVAALMATAASPGAWQTPAADAGKPDVTTLAWGDNGSGQLGDGTTIHRSTPVSVCAPGRTAPCTRFLTDVVGIAAGTTNSLALRKDGTVLAWGDNDSGQLGDGTTINRRTPVRVCAPGQTAPCTRFLTDVVDIAAGTSHSLALRKDGTVLAWGNNGGGQLGDGTSTNRRTPVRVCAPGQTAPCTQFLTHVHTITAHGGHSLALRKDDTVVAWGTNGFGQLGDGTTTNRRTPVRVCAPGQTAPCTQFLTHVHAIAAGRTHSLALGKDGTAFAWGENGFGELGDGTTTNRRAPVRVCAPGQTAPCSRFLTQVHAIGAGRTHSLALRDGGAALAWGNNGAGQLGDGTTTNRRTPVPVCAPGQTAPCSRFLTHVSTITAGGRHSLALAKDAALAWGNNDLGQLGDGTTTDRNTPVRVCAPGQTAPCTRFLTHVHTIDGGGQHSLALVDDQRPRPWFVP
ncbi:RCC1-like domain-containing protein [Streptomyces sp. NPDC057072]|uniref:RCC1-like domain-containing protein n=1 Tax=Streptomyces sp. NPDC057072 TaxID=3346014 RepID=UPI00363D790E